MSCFRRIAKIFIFFLCFSIVSEHIVTGQCYRFMYKDGNIALWPADRVQEITFKIDESVPQEWHMAIRRAAASWNIALKNAGINLRFKTVPDPESKNIITISKKIEYAAKTEPIWSKPSNGIVYIEQVTTYFNPEYAFGFTTTNERGKYDVQGIATHEFGHWLGLGDIDPTKEGEAVWRTCQNHSVMLYPGNIESWLIKLGIRDINVVTRNLRDIKDGDIAGLKALYAHLFKRCVTIAVDIEEHIIRPVPDPAAETAVVQKLIEQGFRVVRQEFSSGQPDVLIKGEAFAQSVGRIGALEQARARIEVKVIRPSTGETIASEGLHAGGVDVNLDLAAKRAFQRAGEKLGERLARLLAQYQCNPISPPHPPKKRIGVNVFESRVHLPDWDGGKMKEEVEKALSKRGIHFAVLVDADVIISGTITDYKVIYKDFGIPILNLFIRTGITYMTVEPQVFDLETGEMIRGEPISDFASGVEILGFKFGFGAQAVAEKIASKIVSWVETRVLPKYR